MESKLGKKLNVLQNAIAKLDNSDSLLYSSYIDSDLFFFYASTALTVRDCIGESWNWWHKVKAKWFHENRKIKAILNNVFVFIPFIRKLEHPHIVTFYGTSLLEKEGTTRVILVMEKCKGSLKNHIFDHPEAVPAKNRNPAGVREVCRWAKEITDALAFMHKQGVVHRNLKLENTLVWD